MQKLAISLIVFTAICPAQKFQEKVERLPPGIAVHANIRYGPHPENVLDVLQPSGFAGRRPAVLVIHGGGWIHFDKERMLAGFCLPFLAQGFAVANANYRVAKEATAPAAVTDVLLAADWLAKNAARYNIDRNRIVVTGESAGGHLSLMVGMTPRSARLGPPARIAAVVNIFGIADVREFITGPNQAYWAVEWLPEQPRRLELAARVSPLTYVRKGLPPILTVHGDQDDTVPYAQAVLLTKKLQEAGVDTELLTIPNGKHGLTNEEWDAALPKIFAFLRQRGILR